MSRRMISKVGPVITLPPIPESLIEIVKIPKALLTPVNRKRVAIYEDVLRFQLFTGRFWSRWSEACLQPSDMSSYLWRRCPTCQRVLQIRPTISDSCTFCQGIDITTAMWGE